MSIIRDWNEFWFARKSPAPLGIFRLALGIIFVLWGILMAPPNLYTWYSETGAVPLGLYDASKTPTIFVSLLDTVTDKHLIFALWIVLLFSAFCFAIGLFTRASAIVLFLAFISFNYRDTLILNSGDTMLRCCLFLMILSPCGRSCSIDRMIAIMRGKDSGGDPAPVEMWTQRLLQIQVTLVYVASFCCKLSGKAWMNGTAVYFPLHMDELVRFPLPALFSSDPMINVLTWGTMVVEGALGSLIWIKRLRPYVLVSGLLLHSGIEYALNIPLFSLIMSVTYLNFVYDEWAAQFMAALARSFRRYRISLQLPNGVTETDRWWLVVQRLDVLKLIQLDNTLNVSSNELIISGRGWQSHGLAAMRRLCLALPSVWVVSPLFLIPGFQKLLKPFLPRFKSSPTPVMPAVPTL